MQGLTEAKEREIIIRDNIANGEWDWEALANSWDTNLLNMWGLQLPSITDEAPELDDKYSQKAGEVTYEPKDVVHEPKDLFEEDSTLDLVIDQIKDPDIKRLCEIRQSYFHKLNYSKIADYYANQATPEEQAVFERLALIILDKDQLIENGFSKIQTIYQEDWEADEDDKR